MPVWQLLGGKVRDRVKVYGWIGGDTPEAVLDGRQRESALRVALESLPPDQLSLVRLAFFEEMSHSEIATLTGLPLGTVKSRLRLAFSRLRRALAAEGLEP